MVIRVLVTRSAMAAHANHLESLNILIPKTSETGLEGKELK